MSTTTTTSVLFVRENHHPLFNFPRMYRAYLACRTSKRNKHSALAFEIDCEQNLLDLVEELRARRYKPSTSICFYTATPKCREIFAAAFRDRIVHHLIYEALSPAWEKTFIHHSYACKPAKGTHAAVFALQKMLRKLTANGRYRAFFLKLDIHNFFMSIDRQILFTLLTTRQLPSDLLWLLEVIVFHDPTVDYHLQDRDKLRFSLPGHKSLFNARPGCGLAIGNLTSQFFANVYLNRLDQFIKHGLKCRFYMRYVDDLVLLDRDADKLLVWKRAITDFVNDNLRLALNERAGRMAPVAGGVDFAGFIVRHNYLLVRRRVIGNMKSKLRRMQQALIRQQGDCIAINYHQETIAQNLAIFNSYLGHFKHARSWHIVRKLWVDFGFLEYFYQLSSHKLIRRDKGLRKQHTLRQQIFWLRWKFPGYLYLVQVGCYYEAFDGHAFLLAKALGLKPQKNWRGFSWSCGFPVRNLGKILSQLRKKKIPLLIVRQTGREQYRTKERELALMLEYPQEKAI